MKLFVRIIYSLAIVIILAGILYYFISLTYNYDGTPKDGELTYLLKEFDFSEGNWRLVIDNHITSYMYINDGSILEKYKNDFFINEEHFAYYTTPDYTVNLYKDDEFINGCAVNNFDNNKFGELENYFINVSRKKFVSFVRVEYLCHIVDNDVHKRAE